MCIGGGACEFQIFDNDGARCPDNNHDDIVYPDDYYDNCGGHSLILDGNTIKEMVDFMIQRQLRLK